MLHYRTCITERILHFKQPAVTSRGVYTTRRCRFVTLTVDGQPGIKGMGECAPLPGLSCDDLPGYEQTLRTACRQLEEEGCIDREQLRAWPSILFGLETALAQLNAGGKAGFFDTPFARGEAGIVINGLVWMGTFEAMYACIEEKLQQGFSCIKLKIGAIDFERELQLVKLIRSMADGSRIELRLDANGAFTPDEALEKLNRLAPYDIHSIEQPIRQRQWNDMARLCRESPIPIALDEELIGIDRLETKVSLLDSIRPAYIILKPSLHGGFSGTEEWIGLARERNIGSWITSALESNIGLNAIAQFAARVYGPRIAMPQGLGTGSLFIDNIPMPLTIRGDQLWFTAQ